MNETTKKRYEIVDIGEHLSGVKILEGPYEDMVWQYGKISFDEGDETLKVKFNYQIEENPNEIEENQGLINFMGDVLMEILEEEMPHDDDDREHNPTPLD